MRIAPYANVNKYGVEGDLKTKTTSQKEVIDDQSRLNQLKNKVQEIDKDKKAKQKPWELDEYGTKQMYEDQLFIFENGVRNNQHSK